MAQNWLASDELLCDVHKRPDRSNDDHVRLV